MAVSNEDLARMIVTLEATTTKYHNALKKAQQQTNNSANAIEKRLTSMSSNIDKTFANLGQRMSANLTGPLAAIGTAFTTREIIRYADAWTEAGNKVAAAGSIVGLQGRSLERLRELADEGRASFEDTIQLYSRILRAAGDVAKSELEVARATNIVNKAFKAGGASTAEMQAGVIQLSQGLASGVLQGDELRSIRENAPVLAQVMADYFKVTIGGLKELGSQGKLTSDEVFKAILSGEQQIEAAFGTTNRTISEGFQLVQNRLIQYIGSADQSLGATAALNIGLSLLADNFDVVADGVLKVAALIAGALVGRSLVAMIGAAGDGIIALRTLNQTFIELRKNGASFGAIAGAAFGPLAILIGGAATLAFQALASDAAQTAAAIDQVTKRIADLGVDSTATARSIREAALATGELTTETLKLAEAERKRNLEVNQRAEGGLRSGAGLDNFLAPLSGNSDLKSAAQIANRAFVESINQSRSAVDVFVNTELKRLAEGLQNSTIPAKVVLDRLRELDDEPISKPTLDLLDALDAVAIKLETIEFDKVLNFDTSEIDAASKEVLSLLEVLSASANFQGDFVFKEGVDELIRKLQSGEQASAETLAALNLLSTNAKGEFSQFLGGIGTAISEVIRLGAQALATKGIIDSINGVSTDSRSEPINPRGEVGRRRRERQEAIAAGQEFLDQQAEYNALTATERDIRDEIENIRKKAPDNSQFDEQALRNQALQNLATKAADKKSNSNSKTDAEKFRESLAEQEISNGLLAEELEFRKQLNPLINDYGFALTEYTKKQELLNEARKAGLSEDEIASMDDYFSRLATGFAEGTAAAARYDESVEKLKETTQEWADFTKSATRSFIDDLIEGKTAAEAFGNVLSQLGSKLIDLGLNTLFGSGGGDFGVLGNLFKLPGRASGGPVTKGQPYIVGEKRPEVFVPNQNGIIIPRVPNSSGSSGSVMAPVSISIDATGADEAGLARLQTELVKMKSELPYLIQGQVSRRGKKGW